MAGGRFFSFRSTTRRIVLRATLRTSGSRPPRGSFEAPLGVVRGIFRGTAKISQKKSYFPITRLYFTDLLPCGGHRWGRLGGGHDPERLANMIESVLMRCMLNHLLYRVKNSSLLGFAAISRPSSGGFGIFSLLMAGKKWRRSYFCGFFCYRRPKRPTLEEVDDQRWTSTIIGPCQRIALAHHHKSAPTHPHTHTKRRPSFLWEVLPSFSLHFFPFGFTEMAP